MPLRGPRPRVARIRFSKPTPKRSQAGGRLLVGQGKQWGGKQCPVELMETKAREQLSARRCDFNSRNMCGSCPRHKPGYRQGCGQIREPCVRTFRTVGNSYSGSTVSVRENGAGSVQYMLAASFVNPYYIPRRAPGNVVGTASMARGC